MITCSIYGCLHTLRNAACAALFVLALMMVSCSGSEKADGARDTYEIDRDFRRGPVSFRVALDREEITIAERVTMLLEARAEAGYIVEMPRFGEKLDEFGIVDYTTPPPGLEGDGSVVTRRTYELEPFLSGDYRIPPMEITFRQEGDTLLHRLESDTIVVHVRSILPEDQAELEIMDIAPPIDYPADYRLALIIAGSVIVAAAAVFVLWRRRRSAVREIPKMPAHEVAYLRLERLLAMNLIEEKRYREFTERVSDILRHYIEDRFGLRAPERTTEEFLIEAGAGLPVDNHQKEIIRSFLVHCDLVKFAALEPTADDVKRTFETCRDFIDATREHEEVKGAA